jgi:hypothetical protein
MRTSQWVVMIVVVLLACRPAGAALVDQGTTTLDTDTGLEWLDLTLTRAESYDSVAAGLGGYTTTEGYRFATVSQVTTLFLDAGISFFDAVFRPSAIAQHVALKELLGVTGGTGNDDQMVSQGLADFDEFDPVNATVAALGVNLSVPGDIFSAFEAAAAIESGRLAVIAKSEVDFLTGSFLVRPAVPEPGVSGLLAAAGVAVLWGRRRRRGR